jgi:hypothetical protein
MSANATGTPTTNFSIPKFNTADDAPNGIGVNEMMDAIDAALDSVRDGAIVIVGTPTINQFAQFNGTNWVPVTLTTNRTVRVPINLTHPEDGNSFWTVIAGTDWDMGAWQFTKDVDGFIWGHVLVPSNLAGSPNAKIKLEIAANATSGVTRLYVGSKDVADGETLNPATLTDETAQDITVPGTAYFRKTVSFTLTNAPSASDILTVMVAHAGAHANDTLNANTILLGAWLEVDVT